MSHSDPMDTTGRSLKRKERTAADEAGSASSDTEEPPAKIQATEADPGEQQLAQPASAPVGQGEQAVDQEAQVTAEADRTIPASVSEPPQPAAKTPGAESTATVSWASPWPEEMTQWPPGKLDTTMPEPDTGDITKLVSAITSAATAIKDHAAGKPVLLHLGIGVGDPAVTLADLNNPTVNIEAALRAWQVNPDFLQDAVTKGYFVVALNINHADASHAIAGFPVADGVHLQVAARFPLGKLGLGEAEPSALTQALTDIVKEAAKVVVVNAISQIHYGGVMEMVFLGARGGRLKACYINAAYEKKKVVVFVPAVRGYAFSHARLPLILGDVFPPEG